jgi:hypothetical protein
MIERCRLGFVDVPNPVYRGRVTRVSLLPADVIAVVWWSKNYRVYQKCHRELAQYATQCFQFTINPRRPDLAWLEPDVPSADEALEQVRFLASLPGGPSMVAWRYDPICFWTVDGEARSSWDPEFFRKMCDELDALGVARCFTSVADLYPRFVARVRRLYPGVQLRVPTDDEVADIAGQMVERARGSSLRLLSCSEARLAGQPGFEKGACVDGALLGATTRGASDRKMRGREECGCTLHTDVGDYATQECGYSCIYCYANPSHRRYNSPSPTDDR